MQEDGIGWRKEGKKGRKLIKKMDRLERSMESKEREERRRNIVIKGVEVKEGEEEKRWRKIWRWWE